VTETAQGPAYQDVQFTVRKMVLAQLADWVLPAVPSGTSLPVHECLEVLAGDGSLQVSATSQHVTITAESPAVSTQAPGAVYIPAKRLKAVLAEAPDGDVTVTAKGAFARVAAGSASWELKLPDPARWSGLPDLSEAGFSPASREGLLTALSTVRHAVGRDPGRPMYTQVRIAESGGVMYASAADAAQFSRAPVPGFPAAVSIPAQGMDDLVKLLGKVPVGDAAVADAGKYTVFRVGAVTLSLLKMARDFPDTDALFLAPTAAHDQVLAVDKAALVKALRRVSITADPKTSAVALIADDSGGAPALTVTSRDAERNSAEEAIPAKWSGGRRVLVVHASFLAAMVAAHPGATCEFRVGRDRSPKNLAHLRLDDEDAGVTSVVLRMPAALMGYS
jgi:DNA polymerase-3 subunit beta